MDYYEAHIPFDPCVTVTRDSKYTAIQALLAKLENASSVFSVPVKDEQVSGEGKWWQFWKKAQHTARLVFASSVPDLKRHLPKRLSLTGEESPVDVLVERLHQEFALAPLQHTGGLHCTLYPEKAQEKSAACAYFASRVGEFLVDKDTPLDVLLNRYPQVKLYYGVEGPVSNKQDAGKNGGQESVAYEFGCIAQHDGTYSLSLNGPLNLVLGVRKRLLRQRHLPGQFDAIDGDKFREFTLTTCPLTEYVTAKERQRQKQEFNKSKK